MLNKIKERPMSDKIIKIVNLCKNYGSEIALQNLNINIDTGSVYGLLGSNGAGKTTLLKLLAGIIKEDAGCILMNEEPIYENIKQKSITIYVSDEPHFLGAHNLYGFAKFYSRMYSNFDWLYYDELLQIFDMDDTKLLKKFSKGMRKLAMFIVCIASQPEVLLLDELIDGIDPIGRKLVWSVLMREVSQREITVILATHNIKEIDTVCSHIGILHHGTCLVEEDIDLLKQYEDKTLESIVIDKLGGISDEVKALLY